MKTLAVGLALLGMLATFAWGFAVGERVGSDDTNRRWNEALHLPIP